MQFWTQITPATPFLIWLLGFIVIQIFKYCWRKFREKPETSISDVVVIEGLDPFYSMLKTKDREFWFREEVSCRERLAIKRIQAHNFLSLIFSPRNSAGARVRSIHNYDILTNPFYQDKFSYVPNAYEGREDYIISDYADPWLQQYSSDIARMVVDLAYLPKSVA